VWCLFCTYHHVREDEVAAAKAKMDDLARLLRDIQTLLDVAHATYADAKRVLEDAERVQRTGTVMEDQSPRSET